MQNEYRDTCVPMLKFNFQLLPSLTVNERSGKVEVGGKMVFALNYFNPYVGIMEPLIEEVEMFFAYSISSTDGKKLVLSLKKGVSINVSDQMIEVLLKFYNQAVVEFQNLNERNSVPAQLQHIGLEGEKAMRKQDH